MACKSFIFKQFIIFVPFCATFPSDFFPFFDGGGTGEFSEGGEGVPHIYHPQKSCKIIPF